MKKKTAVSVVPRFAGNSSLKNIYTSLNGSANRNTSFMKLVEDKPTFSGRAEVLELAIAGQEIVETVSTGLDQSGQSKSFTGTVDIIFYDC